MATTRKPTIARVEFEHVMTRLDKQEQAATAATTAAAAVASAVAVNTVRIERIDTTIAEMSTDIKKLVAFQERQKGAINIILALATAISAVVGWLVSYFSK